MNGMKFIGITGGVGAGKSTILAYLRKNYRVRTLVADEVAHEIMEPGYDCYVRLQKEFSQEKYGCITAGSTGSGWLTLFLRMRKSGRG